MRESVGAYNMASLDDLTRDLGTLAHVTSDQKKSCAHVVFRQYLEQAQRVRIVGPVVIGERELLGAARQAREGAAIPLPGGPHRLISGGDSGSSGGSS